jgi:hypothetical protein
MLAVLVLSTRSPVSVASIVALGVAGATSSSRSSVRPARDRPRRDH